MVVTSVFGPAVVGELIGAMVKSADVMAAPVVVDVAAPVVEVEAAGVGIPDWVFVVAPGVVVVAAGTGVVVPLSEKTLVAPVVFVVAAAVGAGLVVTDGAPFTINGAAAVLADVLQAVAMVKVGPLVVPL